MRTTFARSLAQTYAWHILITILHTLSMNLLKIIYETRNTKLCVRFSWRGGQIRFYSISLEIALPMWLGKNWKTGRFEKHLCSIFPWLKTMMIIIIWRIHRLRFRKEVNSFVFIHLWWSTCSLSLFLFIFHFACVHFIRLVSILRILLIATRSHFKKPSIKIQFVWKKSKWNSKSHKRWGESERNVNMKSQKPKTSQPIDIYLIHRRNWNKLNCEAVHILTSFISFFDGNSLRILFSSFFFSFSNHLIPLRDNEWQGKTKHRMIFNGKRSLRSFGESKYKARPY